jgi:hypothetical protein
MLSVAERLPAPTGEKAIEKVQLAPALTVEPQVDDT